MVGDKCRKVCICLWTLAWADKRMSLPSIKHRGLLPVSWVTKLGGYVPAVDTHNLDPFTGVKWCIHIWKHNYYQTRSFRHLGKQRSKYTVDSLKYNHSLNNVINNLLLHMVFLNVMNNKTWVYHINWSNHYLSVYQFIQAIDPI